MIFADTKAEIDKYAKDKWWQWHIPLWLFGAYFFFKLLSFDLTKPMPFVVSIPHAFDFMLHEFSHVFTAWLPPLVTAAAGSASELILGALLVYGAFQFRNYFASLFCCLWMMLACMGVGSYMADAVPQAIPLVSLGGAMAGSESVTHDWHFIFGELNMLGASALIGGTLKVIGILFGLFGLAFSAWIIYKMAAARDDKKVATEASATGATGPAGINPTGVKAPVYPEAIKGIGTNRDGKEPPHPLDK